MLWERGHGSTYRDIGLRRGIKPETVQAYLRQARKVLEVDTEQEAITEAVRRGIFDLSGPGPRPPTVWSIRQGNS